MDLASKALELVHHQPGLLRACGISIGRNWKCGPMISDARADSKRPTTGFEQIWGSIRREVGPVISASMNSSQLLENDEYDRVSSKVRELIEKQPKYRRSWEEKVVRQHVLRVRWC
jgi:hypothetical protein